MKKPRISYVDPATIKDAAMLAEFDRCAARARRARRARRSAPTCRRCSGRSPTAGATCSRTASPITASRSSAASTSRARCCASSAATSARSRRPSQGIVEDDYRDLINFESSTRYDDGRRPRSSYAEAITWDLPIDDAFWARLHRHFSEPELVEIGYFVALTMGQQRWLRTLDIEHHQILAGTDASMAPGFETEDALKQSKQDPDYWARRKATPSQAAE